MPRKTTQHYGALDMQISPKVWVLISFDLLAKAHYADLHGPALKENLSKDFDAFLRDRAKLVVTAMELLASGASPSIEAVWSAQ